MKKHKLFIISFLLIIIALFTTAAACNLCGIPIEIGEEQQTEIETKKDTELKTEETTIVQEAEAATESEKTEAENHTPLIEKVIMSGKDIKILKTEGTLEKVPGGMVVDAPFTIEVSDKDGDELEYLVYDSLGNYFKVTKIDNDFAIFYWSSPDITGDYNLFIEVTDGKDADMYDIGMTIIKMEETPHEEEGGEIL